MAEERLGPIVRLWGLTPEDLPPTTQDPSDHIPFLISILQEADPFIDSVAPRDPETNEPQPHNSKLWKAKGTKTFAEVSGPVEVYERVVPTPDLEMVAARNKLPHGKEGKIHSETWACRRSVHVDEKKKGTAGWGEWRRCFKEEHQAAEDVFTPSIVSSNAPRSWDCKDIEIEEEGRAWKNFTLDLQESRHAVGRPVLQDRVFAVLQMTAVSAKDEDEILVVSIAVNGFEKEEDSRLAKEKGVVLAAYTSVERIRKIPGRRVEWIMATASDARGVLPKWVQAKAVAGQVAVDVQYFLSWVAKERAGGGGGEEEKGLGHGDGNEVNPQGKGIDDAENNARVQDTAPQL